VAKISNHASWENIFAKYSISSNVERNGFFDITADQIKAVDGKEARLMTKIDFRESLPKVMREEGLSILAIENGLYRIAKNDPFIDIKEDIQTDIIELLPPENLISIDPYNIKSESAALDIAAISDMHKIVFGEDSKLSVRGRLRGSLDFHIGKIPYNVNGVQIEVDGGYESNKSIHLVEAKIGYSNNINIRQLLYPQLHWEKLVCKKKYIKSYIFYLQGDIYRFIPYEYDGELGFADHERERAFRFKLIDKTKFLLSEIKIDQSRVDMSIPFPQADKFEKINTMLIKISQHRCISKEELKTHFDIVDRQIDYYFNVLKWLKLCKEENNCLILTSAGEEILNMSFTKRMQEIAKIVFSDAITNSVLNTKEIDKKIFSSYGVMSQSTIDRRLQTIRAWVSYFKKLFDF
jgi:hypothetical protein